MQGGTSWFHEDGAGRTLAVTAAVQTDWTTFARTGTPAGTPAWPAYVTATDLARTFDATTGVALGIRTPDCDFWDSLH